MFTESEISEEVMIDIEVNGASYEYATNTVEIRIKQEKEVLPMKERGNVVTSSGLSINPQFPNPHFLLNNIVSFDSQHMDPLLYSTLQDRNLCSRLSVKIASEAERFLGRPLYLSLEVTLSPQRLLDAESIRNSNEEEKHIDTCPICLEEDQHLFELPNCSHVFHDYCINLWLGTSNTCPICRTVIDYDSDDDE